MLPDRGRRITVDLSEIGLGEFMAEILFEQIFYLMTLCLVQGSYKGELGLFLTIV